MRVNRLASGSLAAVALLLTSPVSAQSVWTIPGIVNVGGLNNTRFVSDVTLTNPGTSATQLTVSFVPSATPNAKNVTLNAGETLVYRNVVDSLFGTSGAGALSISSDQPLLLRARTYNTASSGTYGVALPVYPNDRLMTAGDTGDALWISQDASGSSGYRTNIAVAFPDEDGGEATVTVYDADGNERGHRDFSLDAPGLQQFSVGSFAGAVSVGRAQVVVTSGRAAGYAVVVDNVTGDSSLFPFEDLPGGIQDVLVNGVARASGRNGAFFRTDGRFYNPTDTDATVTVSFHAGGNANPTPASASFTLPAGRIRDVVDVLDTLLNLQVGSAGALRFRSDWPVAILCRTSNVDPFGVRPGTFGSQQKPVPLLSFLTSADAGAAITGIRQDATFRTNVGFAAGGDGAAYTLTLATAAGATVATTSASLGAFGWAQPGIQDLFPTVTIPPDATLRVKVTAGGLDVFDSSIDNHSGDPVVTPLGPLPVAIFSSATIGPQGGSIRSSDGRLTLRVPAGALSQPVVVSFQEAASDAPLGIGPGYQLLPSGITFAKPVPLTLAYGRTETAGSPADALSLAATDGSGWYIAGGGALDVQRHTLTVPVFSTSPSFPRPQSSSRPSAIRATPAPTWAVVPGYELLPSGRQPIVVGTHRTFVVRATGPSSTMTGERWTLASSPADLGLHWFADAVEGGSATSGYIVPDVIKDAAVYTAPDCPPATRWVRIYAHLSVLRAFFRAPYIIKGVANVLIVPRKYKLTIDASSQAICSANDVLIQYELSDSFTYHVAFSFELDDAIHFERASQTDFNMTPGAPLFCGKLGCGVLVSIDRSDLPQLGTSVTYGDWDEARQKLRFRLLLFSHGPDHYVMKSSCDGYPVENDYLGGICDFGSQVFVSFNPTVPHIETDIPATQIDKKKERTDVKIHLTLESVCP